MEQTRNVEMSRRAQEKHPELCRLSGLKSYRACSKPARAVLKRVLLRGQDYLSACHDLAIPNGSRLWNSKAVQAGIRDFHEAGGTAIPDFNDLDARISHPDGLGSRVEPAKAPEVAPSCTTPGCEATANQRLGGNPYCAKCFAVAYGLYPQDSVEPVSASPTAPVPQLEWNEEYTKPLVPLLTRQIHETFSPRETETEAAQAERAEREERAGLIFRLEEIAEHRAAADQFGAL